MEELLVRLNIYEGPLDLLLHLIKKNEVDLNDIPVALITAQYLEYLELMESMNIELASDFLLMAATLAQIKSRLLLPHVGDSEDDEEMADEIKAALVDPLLEHIKFKGLKDAKEAALLLQTRPLLDSDVFARGAPLLDELDDEPDGPPESMIEASLFDLVDAFRRLAARKTEKKIMRFVVETKTISQRIHEMQNILKAQKSVDFEELCRDDRDQGELVLSFLATLELARIGFLRLWQSFKAPRLRLFLANPDADASLLNDELGY